MFGVCFSAEKLTNELGKKKQKNKNKWGIINRKKNIKWRCFLVENSCNECNEWEKHLPLPCHFIVISLC